MRRPLYSIVILLSLLLEPVLSAAQSAQVLASARAQAEAEVAQISQPYVPVIAPEKSKLTKAAVGYLGVVVMVGASVLQKKIEIERQRGRPFTKEENAALVKETAIQILGDQDVYGMIGAGHLIDKSTQPLLNSLQRAPTTSLPNQLARQIVVGSLGTVVAMGSVSALSELIKKSIQALPPEDREKGQNVIRALATSVKERSPEALKEEARVFGAIAKNMGEIAIFNPEERNLWLYDTWRNEIAKSRFMTTTGSLMAGGTAGGALGSVVPGVGTGIGSVIGGTAAVIGSNSLIPNSYHERVDRKIVKLRLATLETSLEGCMRQCENTLRVSEHPQLLEDRVFAVKPEITDPLVKCEKVRSNIMTLLLDQSKEAYIQQELANQRAGALKCFPRRPEDEREVQELQDKAAARLQWVQNQARDLYEGQIARYQGIRKRLNEAKILDVMDQEISRLTKVSCAVQATLAHLPAHDHIAAVQVFAASDASFFEAAWLPDDASTSSPNQQQLDDFLKSTTASAK